MHGTKRLLALTATLFALLLGCGQDMAQAGTFPEKTLHIVVPFKAGGGTDSIARALAEAIKAQVDQAVVVDNIDGAGGLTGCFRVAQGAPDGYTMLLTGSSDLTAALTYTNTPLSLDQFTYIGGVYKSPTWILAHKDRGYKTLKEFLEAAKANPGKLTLGSGTTAGAQMLMACAIKGITDLDFRIVPYAGGNDLKKALLGNQVDIGIIHAPVMLNEVKAGLINVIGTGMPLDRIVEESLRNTPTLADTAIPVEVGITRGVFVAKGTPAPVAAKLTELVKNAALSPAFAEFGKGFGFNPLWIPGPDFEKLVRGELALFKEIKKKYIE